MEALDDFGDFFDTPPMVELGPADAVTELDVAFDELVAGLIEAPDDEVAFAALQKHITAVRESGRVEQIMQMAMQLSALACSHDIFVEPARSAGEGIGSGNAADGKSEAAAQEQAADDHDDRTCKACLADKPCSKRKRRLFAWMSA